MKKYFIYNSSENTDAIIEQINASQLAAKIQTDYCSVLKLRDGNVVIICNNVTKQFISDRQEVELDKSEFL